MDKKTGSSITPDTVKSITRLVIGGVEIGADELLSRLKIWEDEVEMKFQEGSTASPASAPGSLQTATSDQARLALIGLVFEMQDGLRYGITIFGRLERLITRLVQPILQPILGSRVLAPTRRQYDRLVVRGQEEVSRWIQRGRQEDLHSRVLAEKGFDDVVDTYIEYLATNPELQELVQTQSTGLANEVVEEVRERTVSADTFLESVARSLLRRVPRSALPEPPLALRSHAASLRPEKKGRAAKQ